MKAESSGIRLISLEWHVFPSINHRKTARSAVFEPGCVFWSDVKLNLSALGLDIRLSRSQTKKTHSYDFCYTIPYIVITESWKEWDHLVSWTGSGTNFSQEQLLQRAPVGKAECEVPCLKHQVGDGPIWTTKRHSHFSYVLNTYM